MKHRSAQISANWNSVPMATRPRPNRLLAARIVIRAENTNADAVIVVTRWATNRRTVAMIGWCEVAMSENGTAVRRLIPLAAMSRSAPSAASLAATIVRAETGSGPRTMASRRSNVSASHSNVATTPTATMANVTKTVAISRVSGLTRIGKWTAASSKLSMSRTGMKKPGMIRNVSTPIIATLT